MGAKVRFGKVVALPEHEDDGESESSNKYDYVEQN